MSADSPARSGSRSSTYGGASTGVISHSCATVTPQPITDKSFIDSVTGFINDVVPTSYTRTESTETKEQVQWARFEYADINDSPVSSSSSTETDTHQIPAPLLLILGYTTGVQVWSIPANGEAVEVLSWRQGNVRVLRILPTPNPDCFSSIEDQFRHKRPLIALCDTIAPGPHFCSLSFISLRDGDQVKSIQFKSPLIDVMANKNSVIVTFLERIAIFDACTLEDRMSVTTCFQSPGLCPNPVALGARWLAYAEKTMISSWRSSGGCEGEGVPSYTATVIHAAKSFGKGLRELGESVASSLTGVASHHIQGGLNPGDIQSTTPGVVTILDIQTGDQENTPRSNNKYSNAYLEGSVLAHFIAHSEGIVALQFDPTGLLLLTADKRGHDFHLFKIHPHPCGSALAAVHHLYVLHRGDTTAKVQDMSFSWDSRWVAISTLRGTTHVFPVTPYGGPVGVRTHATPHVVNRLSRFHRSAGLSADGGRSNSPPVFLSEIIPSAVPYSNPRLPPFPHPTIVYPLAQIRQPAQFGPGNISLQTNVRSTTSRQRLSSASEDTPNLKLCAAFAAPRAWLLEPRESRIRCARQTTDSLFIMACHGSLIQYDLDPRHATNIPREKVCDESTIELAVEAKARWMLVRQPNSQEIQVPLELDNPLVSQGSNDGKKMVDLTHLRSEDDDRWLSQVEIVTHAGPHRRLWMGPQFIFKTYNTSNAVPLASTDIEAIEIGTSSGVRPARSNPVNMPLRGRGVGARPLVPVLIESTSASSYEQSPRLLEMHRCHRRDSDSSTGDLQLREDLADAMQESPAPAREQGYGMGHVIAQMKQQSQPAIACVVNPLGTVITLPSTSSSDEAAELPIILDPEIHENCDETLFRPICGLSRSIVVTTSSTPHPVAAYENLPTPPPEPLSDSESFEPTIIHHIPCTVEGKLAPTGDNKVKNKLKKRNKQLIKDVSERAETIVFISGKDDDDEILPPPPIISYASIMKAEDPVLDVEEVKKKLKKKGEIKVETESDEAYTEAENCGLRIGESCKQEVQKNLKLNKKNKNKKSKASKIVDEDFTEIIAIESEDIKEDEEFLSLEPEKEDLPDQKNQEEYNEVEMDYLNDDPMYDMMYRYFIEAEEGEEIEEIENSGVASANSTESDDSCKIKSVDVLEEVEPLIPLIVDNQANIQVGQTKGNKKKTRAKKRR